MKSNDNLTKELLLESVSKFADLEIAQHQKFIYETGNLPEGLFAKMVNFGFLSLTIPKEYGGSGFDKEEFLPQGNQRIFGFSSTEPSGGTNVRNMRTEAFYQGTR